MAGILELMGHVQQQGELGRKQGQQARLASLMGQAFQAPREQRQPIFGQMAQVDPQSAFDAEKGFRDMDDNARAQLGQSLAAFDTLPDDQKAVAYPQLAQQARSMLGLPVPLEWNPAMAPNIQKLAQVLGGAQQQEMRPHVVGNALVDASGKVLYQGEPDRKWQLVNVPDGNNGFRQMEYSNGQWRQPTYGGGMPAPTTGGGGQVLENAATEAGDIVSDVTSLVSPFGGRITSTTGGRHNPGSQHYSGNAVDIGMGRETPEQQAQILAALSNDPRFKVRDERSRPSGQDVWSGPHLHVERAQQVAQAGQMGYTPPKSSTRQPPAGYTWRPDGSLAPIPGGPAQVAIAAREDAAAARRAAEEAKAAQKRQVEQARQSESASSAQDLVFAIDSLTKSSGFDDLGTFMGDIEINTPLVRNDAKDANAQLKNIAGQVALATMARLKALSSQGATGFGALSAPELKLLENSIATLQSEDISNKQLKDSLDVIKAKMKKITDWKPASSGGGKYQVGQIIEANGKRYRVTDVSDPADPDVEEVP